MSAYSAPKGTYDVFPGGREPHERPELWAFVEGEARHLFRRYNYAEVRTPVFEEAQLFVRSVGEASDIVRKEMFVFEDKGGQEPRSSLRGRRKWLASAGMDGAGV